MSRPLHDLTTTSYAILGLLAIRPWTTYELAKQMERTINRHWPSARSKHYSEPKKLEAIGLASSKKESVGRRPRTVYSITPRGRRELKAWLATPSSGPSLEFEHLTKLFFADHGDRDAALQTLHAASVWAAGEVQVFADVARSYLAGSGPFPERLAVSAIGARFLVDFYSLVHDWARWASGVVATWPQDPAKAEPDLVVFRQIARRGDEILAGTPPTSDGAV